VAIEDPHITDVRGSSPDNDQSRDVLVQWGKRFRGCRLAITWNYLECRLPSGMTLGVHDGWHVLRLPFRRLHYCPRIIIGGDSMLGGSCTL
jgi:hypothetical protein